MAGERPRVEDLPLVDDGESILRLVHPRHYEDGRLETARVAHRLYPVANIKGAD